MPASAATPCRSDSGADDMKDLELLCKPHHGAVTARQRLENQIRKIQKLKSEIKSQNGDQSNAGGGIGEVQINSREDRRVLIQN